jgi:hypothetical protein
MKSSGTWVRTFSPIRRLSGGGSGYSVANAGAESPKLGLLSLLEANPGTDPWLPKAGTQLTVPLQMLLPDPGIGAWIGFQQAKQANLIASRNLFQWAFVVRNLGGLSAPAFATEYPLPPPDSRLIGENVLTQVPDDKKQVSCNFLVR